MTERSHEYPSGYDGRSAVVAALKYAPYASEYGPNDRTAHRDVAWLAGFHKATNSTVWVKTQRNGTVYIEVKLDGQFYSVYSEFLGDALHNLVNLIGYHLRKRKYKVTRRGHLDDVQIIEAESASEARAIVNATLVSGANVVVNKVEVEEVA